MTYPQTLDFLYSKLPMFTRVGEVALKKDLTNTLNLCSALGNPQNQFKSIHIGGTNGKGSTSHMIAAILQKAGYKTGLYTSPHLKDFRERIRINGKMIPKSKVIEFVKSHRTLVDQIQPSFFEMTVALAFDFFASEKVDIAVIEVGLGGRLDSTNIISPEIAVITNISFDHVQILGNTLPEIAYEKAGIIKSNTPVIIGEQQPETTDVFVEKAKKENAPLVFANSLIQVVRANRNTDYLEVDLAENGKMLYAKLKLDLNGYYQQKNSITVIESIRQLRKKGFQIPDKAIYQGLRNTKKITGLQGRWQKLGNSPLIICDTGHNEAGIREVLLNISDTPHHKLHIVIGMVKDKDISKVLQLLPKSAQYYFCSPQIERGLPVSDLAELASTYQLMGNAYPSVKQALQEAKNKAEANDLVFIGGSTFVVAEII